jgi:aspartate racemase
METQLIGIVAGLGPAATTHYYIRLLEECKRQNVIPRLMFNQARVELVLDAAARGDREALADHIAERMSELQRAGVNLLAIAAVTPHLCMPELVQRISTPIVDMVEVTESALCQLGVARVALMGTRAVVASRLFGRLDTIAADPTSAQIERVHDLYVAIVQRGRVDSDVAAELRALAAEYVEQLDVEVIVLAGTELALAPPVAWEGIRIVDCAALHVEAIVSAATRRE